MCLCYLNLLLEPGSTVVGVTVLCDNKDKCNYDMPYVIWPPLRTTLGGLCVILSSCDQRKMCLVLVRPGTISHGAIKIECQHGMGLSCCEDCQQKHDQ